MSSGLLCVPCLSFTTQRYCVVCTVRDVMDMLCVKSLKCTCSQYCLSVVSQPFGLFVLYKCDVFCQRGDFIVFILFHQCLVFPRVVITWVRKKGKKHIVILHSHLTSVWIVRQSHFHISFAFLFFCCIFLCFCLDLSAVLFLAVFFLFQSTNNRTVR